MSDCCLMPNKPMIYHIRDDHTNAFHMVLSNVFVTQVVSIGKVNNFQIRGLTKCQQNRNQQIYRLIY